MKYGKVKKSNALLSHLHLFHQKLVVLLFQVLFLQVSVWQLCWLNKYTPNVSAEKLTILPTCIKRQTNDFLSKSKIFRIHLGHRFFIPIQKREPPCHGGSKGTLLTRNPETKLSEAPCDPSDVGGMMRSAGS